MKDERFREKGPGPDESVHPFEKSLATLRHDLRNPIHQIVGFGELLEEEARDAGRDGEAADLVKIQTAARSSTGSETASGLPGPGKARLPRSSLK